MMWPPALSTTRTWPRRWCSPRLRPAAAPFPPFPLAASHASRATPLRTPSNRAPQVVETPVALPDARFKARLRAPRPAGCTQAFRAAP